MILINHIIKHADYKYDVAKNIITEADVEGNGQIDFQEVTNE